MILVGLFRIVVRFDGPTDGNDHWAFCGATGNADFWTEFDDRSLKMMDARPN